MSGFRRAQPAAPLIASAIGYINLEALRARAKVASAEYAFLLLALHLECRARQ